MKKKIDQRTVIIVLCIIIIVAVCTILIGERVSGMKAGMVQNEVKQLMEQGKKNASAASPKPAQSESDAHTGGSEAPGTDPDAEPVIQDDFLPLLEQNEHFVGWLTADENIDYPVVQYNNYYYLTHNFFGAYDINGIPFMDEHNSLLPKDDVLIIDGHNMKSGAIFGRLKRYMDYDYMSRNPLVTFRTIYDAEDVYYTPVAVVNFSLLADDKHFFNVKRINFETDEDFQSYIDEITERSEWEAKIDVQPGDKMLALLTCSYFYNYGRLLLLCRQLRDGETPESIEALYAD